MIMYTYNTLYIDSLALVKEGLATIQLRESGDQTMSHPKLHSMISIVNTWKITTRKHTLEKVQCSIYHLSICIHVYVHNILFHNFMHT